MQAAPLGNKWRAYWVRARPGSLSVYETFWALKAKAEVPLNKLTQVEASKESHEAGFCIRIGEQKRSFLLACINSQEMKDWIDAINSCRVRFFLSLYLCCVIDVCLAPVRG